MESGGGHDTSRGRADGIWWRTYSVGRSCGMGAGFFAAMSLGGGVAGTVIGGVQLGRSYSGETTAEQDRELAAEAGKVLTLSSPLGLLGGVTGQMVTRDEEGLETGALFGGLAEAFGIPVLGIGRAALRWRRFHLAYRGSKYTWNDSLKRALRKSYLLGSTTRAETRSNPLLKTGIEKLELSHFIPQEIFKNSPRLRRILKSPLNVKPLWGSEHALVDKSRHLGREFSAVHKRYSTPRRWLYNAPEWLQYSAYGVVPAVKRKLHAKRSPKR